MTTITTELSDELLQAITAYIEQQPDCPSVPSVIQTALQTFLAAQGYLPTSPKRLQITPANQGSGYSSTSIEHDRVLAGLDLEPPI